MTRIKIILLLSTMMLLAGCGKELVLLNIDEYISQNALDVQTTASGLKYIIEFEGLSERPTIDDKVTVAYKGYRTDGVVFDSNINGTTFELNSVIEGWKEGIQLFGKGGRGQLFIPSELGYGNQPPARSDIPVNADLIFDIELLNF